jgi:hypothetical protein
LSTQHPRRWFNEIHKYIIMLMFMYPKSVLT